MALISQVTIANLALSLVHTKGIESLADEAVTEAVVANLWYDPARREVLEAFNWGFGRRRLTLATHALAAPANEWACRYQYPTDCVAPRYLENPDGPDGDAVPFSKENATDDTLSIVTDLEDAVLVYTRDVTNPLLFTPHFVVTLAARLAYYMAGTLSNKQSLQANLLKQYNTWLATAGALDAAQEVERAPRDADYIRAR